jgi:hypothetical protein
LSIVASVSEEPAASIFRAEEEAESGCLEDTDCYTPEEEILYSTVNTTSDTGILT